MIIPQNKQIHYQKVESLKQNKMLQKYEILDTLGEGSFGKVKLAKADNAYFAIKFSTTNNAYSQETLKKIFEKQALILRELDHPHVIKLREIIVNGKYQKKSETLFRSALVFQYAPYNLADILQLGALQESVCRTLFFQLLQGIEYLHCKNIIHRDIKPQNLLFDEHFNIKICDFGLSTKVDNDTKPKTVCGSDSFKSPEMLMRKNYNGVMNDLFAAGVTLFILMTGKAPFINANPNTGLYQFIALNYPQKFWKMHDKKLKYSLQFKNIINSMLAFDPTHRLSIAEILSHSWMGQDILMGNELDKKLKKKHNQCVQKRRKLTYNALRSKVPFIAGNKVSRSSTSSIPKQFELRKTHYNKRLTRITDRFTPRLVTCEQLEFLFEGLGKLYISHQGKIHLLKTVKEEIDESILDNFHEPLEEQLKIEINVESMDEETDCLKFKLLEGNVADYVKLLHEFDQKILADNQ